METKYIFITGGVVSSLGKGIIGSSIGQLLKKQGFKVAMQKFDPYINVQPGLLDPKQHGEIFVTDDGTETDLDLGHYERFLDESIHKSSTVTTGQVYLEVIEKEKQGYYKGQTVQVIPHITNKIKEKLVDVAKATDADIVITEIGGTVGDIESLPFLEAIRQARIDLGYHNTLYIHTTLVPYIRAAKEIKTKPTQHSVKQLMNLGIYPDMLVIRSERKLKKEVKEKIATFTGLKPSVIFESVDIKIIYGMILNLHKQKIDKEILEHFKLDYDKDIDLSDWQDLINKIKERQESVDILMVGTHVSHKDAYISAIQSLKHAGFHLDRKINVITLNSNKPIDEKALELIEQADGIIVPGGFGNNGVETKIDVIEIARKNNIPFLGIGLGMQLTTVEILRNLSNTSKKDIVKRVELPEKDNYVVGLYGVELKKGSLIAEIYGKENIEERYKNRYEVNRKYIDLIEKSGFEVTGFNKATGCISVIENKEHPFFIAVQYHPEFLSRPLRAHPLFLRFIESVKTNKK